MSWYLIVVLGLIAEAIARVHRRAHHAVEALQPLVVYADGASRPLRSSVPSERTSP